jgi:hypothetical protein
MGMRSMPAHAGLEGDRKGFWSVYADVLFSPVRGFERLAANPRRRRYGTAAIALTAAVYQLVYLFLAHNGGRPTVFKPWLAIPAEVYYRYDQLLIVPSIALAWIAAAGVTHLIARLLGGRGSYEDTLAVLAVGISISSWWTGLHDLLTTWLGFVGLIDQRAYENAMSTAGTVAHAIIWTLMSGYAIAFAVTFVSGTKAAHRLRPGPAVLAGAFGLFTYQVLFLLFNR